MFSPDLNEYFDKLYIQGIKLSAGQKLWYSKKKDVLQDDMTREFPSYPDEAFESSQVGNWYATQMKDVYDKSRVTQISYDKSIPVHTAWDLGQADFTAIWFFQINRVGEIMIIDYFQKGDTPLDQLVQIINSKGYTYGVHLWPHDARARDRAGITFETQARNFNISGLVLEQSGFLDGINLVRSTLSRCWFDGNRCREGLAALENYKKKWNSQIGGFSSDALHDSYSHGADAFRYLCVGIQKISQESGIENDIKAIRAYWG